MVVTHELASIFEIADDSVFLDPQKTLVAKGDPKSLLNQTDNQKCKIFYADRPKKLLLRQIVYHLIV